jgi:DNA modification methylase
VAKAFYERYSEEGDRVLDFCAGYGGRLLGCLTLRRYYVGFDPCRSQALGLRRTHTTIKDLGLATSHATVDQVCAEEGMRSERARSFDLIFTSPPYFDREKYSSEPTQSYVRYPTYSEWREGFLERVIAESHRVLKPGGFLILNVADSQNAPVARDTKRYAKKWFRLAKTYWLRLNALPYTSRLNGTGRYHHEPIFVFDVRHCRLRMLASELPDHWRP